jgi:anti-anti-sigma factor
MPKPFRLTVDLLKSVPLLCLSGDMILGQNLRELHDEVRDLAAEGHTRLVLDLTEVESADSTGIEALVDAKHALGEATSTVFLLRPSILVRNSLTLSGVTSMFEVVGSEPELVRRL